MSTLQSVNDTHAADLTSWLESANDPAGDFPIQNLPYGRFKLEGDPDWRLGAAIGDAVLDVAALNGVGLRTMEELMAATPEQRSALRAMLSAGLRAGSERENEFRRALYRQSDVRLGLPCDIGDYTD
ncbi:fumarylacetoacetase, partial [Oxalobacteraceae bacterium OM1]